MPKMGQAEAFERLGQFPHCDHRLLHAPGTCQYCDAHPEWQALRIAWGINFTGENDPERVPCPGSLSRTAERAHEWGGNRPKAADPTPPAPPPRSIFERLRDNPFKDE